MIEAEVAKGRILRAPALSPRRVTRAPALPRVRARGIKATSCFEKGNIIASVIDDVSGIPPLSSSSSEPGSLCDYYSDEDSSNDPPSAPRGDPPSAPGGDPPSAPGGDPPSAPGGDPPSAPRGDPPSAPRGDPPSAPLRVHAPNRRLARRVEGESQTRCIEDEYPQGTGKGRILAYVRRSAEDRRNRPLAAQFETINAYVREIIARDPDEFSAEDFVREYFVDNGISGTTQPKDRPALSALMDVVSHVGRMHVVAYDTTRIARSVNVGNNIRTHLETKGATIHLAQSRMVVEGNNADMIFGIGLQVASSERTNTIMRIRSSFRSNPNWDTRRSFGWRLEEGKLVEHAGEQAVLVRMRELFEAGALTRDVAAALQVEFGARAVVRDDGTVDDAVAWEGANVAFFANKYGWRWPAPKGGEQVCLTGAELGTRALAAVRAHRSMDAFMEEIGRGAVCDGVRVNRAMLRRFFTDENPPWKYKALDLARTWVRQEKHSIDDIANMLDENAPRPRGAWTRQTAWRLVRHAEKLNELDRTTRSAR